MQKFKFFTLAILAMLSVNLWSAVTPLSLPKEWGASDGKSAYTEALGCTLSGLGSDYSSAPKLKFDNQGDYMIIQVADAPDEISFNIKGNSVSGTYSFKVQESDDGSSYTDALNITSVTGSSANKSASLKSSTRYIKLIYTTKASGNMGVGGISITKASGGGDGDWELVTDASTLKAGDILVIGCSSKGATAGNISSSIMTKKTSTFNAAGSKITELGEGTVELTLGGTSGAWTFANSSKQLLGATDAKKVAWGSGTTTWSISISDGIATIQNGTSSYGRFLYNANSGQERFVPYATSTSTSTTMLLPQLYRKPSTCTAPTITKDLSETEVAYTKGATATALSINATGTDVTYQWYSNTSKSTTGATTLTGQTSASYTPSTATTGTTYYYCVASSSTCTTTSKFAKITVNEPSYTITATKNDASLGNVSLSGKVITATPNACVGYANPAYTVAPAGKATVAQNGNIFTVSNVTADVTVTINFAALAKDTYVDRLHNNADIEECGSYEAPSLPDAAKATIGDCDVVHYHFAGWVTDIISTGTPGAPSGMITAGTAMNANGRTYIAVWAKEE